MQIKISALTDVGKVRENNEDSFTFCPDLAKAKWFSKDSTVSVEFGEYGALAAVADGMGGVEGGEIASSIAISKIKECFIACDLEKTIRSQAEMCKFLEGVVQKINLSIIEYVDKNPCTMGMGTTLVLVWITNSYSILAWCGDSRCYTYEPVHGMHRLSKDHSYVQDLIDRNVITEKESLTHPDNNIITRCLGDVESSSEPELKVFEISGNEMLILCSDGLCGYCNDLSIENVVSQNFNNPKRCRDSLFDLAMDNGGKDNVAIITIYISNKKESILTKCFNKLSRVLYNVGYCYKNIIDVGKK